MATSEEKKAKSALFIVISIAFVSSVALRLINNNHFEQSSLLFIGLPTLIALLVVRYTGRPNSAYGIAFKTITLFLLLAGILFGEGIICIIMAAPLLYGVTFLLIAIYQFFNKDEEEDNILHVSLLIPVALVLSQPGNFNQAPFMETVVTSKLVENAHIHQLTTKPDFEHKLPLFFQSAFPKPLSIEGDGLAVGDQHAIDFKSSTKGVGSLVLEVKSSNESSVVFKVVSDESHIAHWLSWKEVAVEIKPINENESLVSWTTHYSCELEPYWYFGNIERFAVDLSNAHLIDSFFGTK